MNAGPAHHIGFGIVAILVAAACLSGMDAIFASLIKSGYPVFMLQGVRNWICVAMLGLWLLARDGKHFNPFRQGAPLMLARGALVYCTAMMFFIALKDLDLGTVTTLLFFYPVVATIIAAVFLREPIGLWRGLAVVLGFVGVVVAVQPGGDLFHPSSLLPLCASVGFAIYQTTVRWVPRSVTNLEITFATFFAMAVAGTPGLFVTWQPVASVWDWGLILGATGLIVVGTQAMTIAFRIAPIALIGSLDYSAILFAITFGYILFGDLPGLQIWIAIPLIVGSGIIIAVRESIVARRQAK